jgi:hypothetical protein
MTNLYGPDAISTIGRRFKNDTERLENLFDLYVKMATAGTT